MATGAHRRGDWRAAEAAFTRIHRDAPQDALVALNLAHVQHRLGRSREAMAALQRCLRLAPGDRLARVLAGEVMMRDAGSRHASEYLDSLGDPPWLDDEVLAGFAAALKKEWRIREAIEVAMRGLARRPDHAGLHRLLVFCMRDLGLRDEAVECAKTVLALDPDDLEVLLHMLFDQREACDWSRSEETIARIAALAGDPACQRVGLFPTFSLLSLEVDPLLTRQLAVRAAQSLTPAAAVLPPASPSERRDGPLRLGFLSYDLREHPVGQLLVETFEHLDRGRCELHLFSTGPDDGSELRARIARAADSFVDLREMTTAQAVSRVREAGVDVLVDLSGYTRGSRLELLAHRPAPVQACYLGYPGTTGAAFVDYLVGDAIVTPVDHAAHYVEKIAQIDGCMLPGTRYRPAPRPMSRAEAGLPEDAFVMAALHPPYKILPKVFDLWCEVLRAEPSAVLWLKAANEQMVGRLEQEALRRGVGQGRIVWARRTGYLEYLSQFALADVFVDTWPYNAHTTAADALWAGLPLLALRGSTFASRVSASLLHAAGLDDWVCDGLDSYRERLLALARDRSPLAEPRQRLCALRDRGRLFDSRSHATSLLDLFERMHSRRCEGLAPDHLLSSAA